MSTLTKAGGLTASAEEHKGEGEFSHHLLLDPRPQEELNQMVLESMNRTGLDYWIVVGVLALLALVGFVGAWVYQIRWGMGVAGINRPNYWGVYIGNFVFWVGISHSGTFVSAILRVFKAEFRRPITRAAEMMTTVSLLVAVSFLGIHVGRTWRGYWILPYPNQRGLWPNFHSPFLFDEIAIASYLVGSTLYLYLPLIPDLAMARDRTAGWRKLLYRAMAFGWRGTEVQWRNLQLAINVFAFVIIPVMFSVHTIVAWDFALTKVTGWHSSIFGPYFVVGAIFSGVSAVTNVLFIARATMKLDYFIRKEHFDALAKLILVFSFVWTYFFFTDFFVEWYGGDATGHQITAIQTLGPMAPLFYVMLFFNIVVPVATLWSKSIRNSPVALFLVALGVNVGMYLERFIIVTGFLRRNDLPFNWGAYTPSWVEIFISLGSVAVFLLLYALLSRLFPIIPVWEVREGQLAHTLRRFGKALIPSIAELEE
jgi:molybdopterin-containing oxidoreductase family membrane subunit